MRSTRPMASADASARPRLAPHVRMRYDTARGQHVLLSPESIQVLNATGAAILGLCDGRRTVPEIQHALANTYAHVGEDDVRDFVSHLLSKRSLEVADG